MVGGGGGAGGVEYSRAKMNQWGGQTDQRVSSFGGIITTRSRFYESSQAMPTYRSYLD